MADAAPSSYFSFTGWGDERNLRCPLRSLALRPVLECRSNTVIHAESIMH